MGQYGVRGTCPTCAMISIGTGQTFDIYHALKIVISGYALKDMFSRIKYSEYKLLYPCKQRIEKKYNPYTWSWYLGKLKWIDKYIPDFHYLGDES